MSFDEFNKIHDNKLNLSGDSPDFSRYKIKKNQPVPVTRHKSSMWDHLIAKLDRGDTIDMSKKDASSFTSRARNAGYVVVLRRKSEDGYCVWFGGLKK